MASSSKARCLAEEATDVRQANPAKIMLAALGATAVSLAGSKWSAFVTSKAAARGPQAAPYQSTSATPRGSAVTPPNPAAVASATGLCGNTASSLLFPAAVAGLAAAGAAARGRRRHGGVFGRRMRGVALRARGGGKDFYEVLGCSRSASDKEIKSNFRRLARQYHPDVNKEPGAQEKFQEIARAYEVLSDSTQRARYDQFGEAGVQGAGAGPDISSLNLEDILGDVFSSFFAGGGGGMPGMGGMGGRRRGAQQGPQKGSDLQCEVEFPFDLACFGGEKKVQVRREEKCETCDGSGAKKGVENTKCSQCNGSGITVQVMSTPLGVMQTQGVCPRCGGSGVDPSAVCGTCKGKGTVSKVQEVSVKVPAGCADGNQLRVRGEGDKGSKGGPSGDLYIAVKVTPSAEFSREGFDILTESSIDLTEAVLGTTLKVRTIDGDAEIKVPSGTQPGTKMRIKGRGVPKLGQRGQRGDHYITIKVKVPRSLSDDEKKKYEELRDLTKVKA